MLPKLYQELASWWPLPSTPSDYEEEAAFYLRALLEASDRAPRTLLELGSGGGNDASHLKEHFPFEHSELEPGGYELFVARRPA